jgi:hypothetical protein
VTHSQFLIVGAIRGDLVHAGAAVDGVAGAVADRDGIGGLRHLRRDGLDRLTDLVPVLTERSFLTTSSIPILSAPAIADAELWRGPTIVDAAVAGILFGCVRPARAPIQGT